MSIKSFVLFLLCLVGGIELAIAQVTITPVSSTSSDFKYELTNVDKVSRGMTGVNYFRFFWYFGDGTSAISGIRYIPGNTIAHEIVHSPSAVPSNGNISLSPPYVEITALTYTDNIEPERIVFNGGVFNAACSNCQQLTTANTPAVEMYFNRNLVPGHLATLVVPYRFLCNTGSGTGEITLNYPMSQLHLEAAAITGGLDIYGQGINTASNNPQIGPGRITFAVTPQPYTQYLHIPMVVPTGRQEQENIEMQLEYDFGFPCGKDSEQVGTIQMGTMLSYSHDPNVLSSIAEPLCECDAAKPIEYIVEFQNIGQSAVDQVIIKDFIADAYDLNKIEVVAPLVNNVPPPMVKDPVTREVTWTLTGNYLEGQDELEGAANANTPEYKTIDSLVFNVYIQNCDSIRYCNVIPNQAEIIFDCNPSIFTNPYLVRMGCNPALAPPNPNNCNCDLITFPKDTIVLLHPDSVTTSNFSNQLTTHGHPNLGLSNHIRWYPSRKTTEAWQANPTLTTRQTRQFFAVATPSNDCIAALGETLVQIDCTLPDTIAYEVTCTGNTKSIRAWIPNNTTKKYLWNNCQLAIEMTESNLSMLDLPISVTDPETNCHTSIIADLRNCINPPPPPPPWWAAITAVIMAGGWGFWRFFRRT